MRGQVVGSAVLSGMHNMLTMLSACFLLCIYMDYLVDCERTLFGCHSPHLTGVFHVDAHTPTLCKRPHTQTLSL
jgi:hypothetical protein